MILSALSSQGNYPAFDDVLAHVRLSDDGCPHVPAELQLQPHSELPTWRNRIVIDANGAVFSFDGTYAPVATTALLGHRATRAEIEDFARYIEGILADDARPWGERYGPPAPHAGLVAELNILRARFAATDR